MKKYELKNYINHKSAEIHTDVIGYENVVFVMYYRNGEPDCDVRGASEPHSGCKRFRNETAAMNSARRYVTKNDAEKMIDLCDIMCR